jgi:hypothetical protein
MRTWETEFSKQLKSTRSLTVWFIGIVLTLIICLWIGVSLFVYVVAKQSNWSGGIKPAIEQLWCGKPGCLTTDDTEERK